MQSANKVEAEHELLLRADIFHGIKQKYRSITSDQKGRIKRIPMVLNTKIFGIHHLVETTYHDF